MAKLSLGDKASRVLKLLMGLRNARIAAAMGAYGFNEEDLQDGWRLLQSVSRAKLGTDNRPVSSDTIEKLDAWENRWFPVATATLERRFPAIHAQVFKNLSQTSGPAVAVSVGTLIERFDEMAAGKGPYGSDGKKAKTLLESRGMTKAVIAEARALLEAVGSVDIRLDITSAEQDQQALAKAETDLWSWYLEWSQIARIAVKQRALLRQMGFIQSRAGDVVVEEPPPAAPTPIPGGTNAPAPGGTTAPTPTPAPAPTPTPPVVAVPPTTAPQMHS